jgi:polyribonucleotide nucleotidyltransferase
MDFKVAGTAEFVTGPAARHQDRRHPADVLAQALQQAKEPACKILEVMRAPSPSP